LPGYIHKKLYYVGRSKAFFIVKKDLDRL